MPYARPAKRRTPKKRAATSRRASFKARRTNRRNYRLGNRPSRSINRAPKGYAFTREVLDRDNNYGAMEIYDMTYAASNHKYGFLRLGLNFNELAAHADFGELFSQYMMRSMTFNITSFFDGQMPGFEAIAATGAPAPRYTMPLAPKVEMIVVPNDSVLAINTDWQSLTIAAIELRLAQLQRKQVTTLTRSKKFHVSKPQIQKMIAMSELPQLGGAVGVDVNVRQVLTKAPWLPLTTNGQLVRHYGVTIIFRRVDGQAFQDPSFWSTPPPVGPGIEEQYQPLPKLRLVSHANFSCRSVR